MLRPSLGITPQPAVGLCGETHLDGCSQELNQLWQPILVITLPVQLDLDRRNPTKSCEALNGSEAKSSSASLQRNPKDPGGLKRK